MEEGQNPATPVDDAKKEKRKERNRAYYLKKQMMKQMNECVDSKQPKTMKTISRDKVNKLKSDASIIQAEIAALLEKIVILDKTLESLQEHVPEPAPEPAPAPAPDKPKRSKKTKKATETA